MYSVDYALNPLAVSQTNRQYNTVLPVAGQQDQAPLFNRDPREANTLPPALSRSSQRSATDRLVRGELLDVVEQQRRNNALYAQQVSPENRNAIAEYLSGEDPRGRLLDRLA